MILPNKILNLVKAKSKGINIPNFKYIYFQKNSKDFEWKIEKIFFYFKNKKKIIVRSAAFDEDNKKTNAGKYDSIIINNNLNNLIKSINEIINKYQSKSGYVLIQEYVQDSYINGVIFTKDPNGFENYKTINYFNGKNTSRITSGEINGGYFVFYNNQDPKKIKDNFIRKIIIYSKQIEKIFKSNELDIEFSINKKKKISIFQIRKLNISKNHNLDISKVLNNLEKKLKKMISNKSLLPGKSTIYSNMTDWNPAEIIGIKPKTLASSTYKELITDQIWSVSREQMGYSNCYGLPLTHEFLGSTYVDLRTCFNSFIPKELNFKLKEKIINFYFREFKKKPYYFFDKIESELVFSSLDFQTNDRLKILKKAKFEKNEITHLKKSLNSVTNNAIKKLKTNIKISNKIIKICQKISKQKLHPINKIYNLINICKNFGTLPFANIARMAFIAMQFLNSMVKKNIISHSDKENFLKSLKSITGEMQRDFINLNKKLFLSKYGHLRPNTYEINSFNYGENYKGYFRIFKNDHYKKYKKFKFSKGQISKISNYLIKYDIDCNYEHFIEFLGSSIVNREKSKFNFTYCLNEIFKQIKILSKKIKINPNDQSFIDITIFKKIYGNFSYEKVSKEIKNNIILNKNNFKLNQNIKLPNIILQETDIYMFNEKKISPTYVGKKNVNGNIVTINGMSKKINLDNKIVFIYNADPGYDFIFTKKIKGLITAYGGPNSHMFIRCNEIGIPAAIGVGDKNFNKLKKSNKIFLNCVEQEIKSI